MPAFDRKATAYNHHAHIQRDTAAWVAEWLPARQTNARCVEFGAGTGNLTHFLADTFGEVLASDISPQMIEEGKRALPRVHWTQQDAWQPTITKGAWNWVASCSVLQWARDPVATLVRWHDLLCPGGKLISGIYVRPSLGELQSLLPADRCFGWHSPAQWQTYVKQAGFNLVRAEHMTRCYCYPSALMLLKRLHGTGATVLGRPMRVGALRNLIKTYEQRHATPDGIRATWTFCRLEAEKSD